MSYGRTLGSIDTQYLHGKVEDAKNDFQPKLTAGEGIAISSANVISVSASSTPEMIFMDYYNWGDGPWSGLPSEFTAILDDVFSEDSATSRTAILKLFNAYTIFENYEYLHSTYVYFDDASDEIEDPSKKVNVYFGAAYPEISGLLGILFEFDILNETITCTVQTNN